jgi:AcrR family transcriptional regulator
LAKQAAKVSRTNQIEANGDPVRERILAAFSSRARRSGVRAILMGELASELRMSAMTLYKHFASKDELVTAMVDAWALELAALDALEWEKAHSCSSALEVLLSWADAWSASLARVSPTLFADLQRDHPIAWKRFSAQIDERKQIAARHLVAFLRDDVHPGVAILMLDTLVMQAADPGFVETVGISRREAVRSALAIWAGGALKQRVALRAKESR